MSDEGMKPRAPYAPHRCPQCGTECSRRLAEALLLRVALEEIRDMPGTGQGHQQNAMANIARKALDNG